MAFGYLPYKTPNPINLIGSDLTSFEGHGVYLTAEGEITLATSKLEIPYGVIAVGCDSETPGEYPSAPIAGSLEIVDSIGCVVQATAGLGGVFAGSQVSIGPASHFVDDTQIAGDWVWGLALTSATAGQQFLMRFQPAKSPYLP
jgi:hypothetical protein